MKKLGTRLLWWWRRINDAPCGLDTDEYVHGVRVWRHSKWFCNCD